MNNTSAAYISGLFDGEGCVTYSKTPKKRKGRKNLSNTWNIRMEISMTDEDVIRWVHEQLKVGTVCIRRPIKSWVGKKTQWRWRCSHRDALYVAKILWPYAQVKLHKLEQIIAHYEPRAQELGDNIVDLEIERQVRKFNWNMHDY